MEVDEEFMGMALGLSYLAGGIACIFHLLVPFTNYALAYSGNVGLGSIALILTCLFMEQGEWNRVIVLILLVIFGWGTCTNIVVTATIMNKYHQAQEDSCLVGFWMTGSDMGNILGFIISTTLLYSLQLPYQWVIIIAGSMGMMVAVVFYLTLSESTSE
jgi:uncharacterized membrane protein